jgi:RNA polymerase sigma-70 factor, ECF subfamily
VTRPAPQKPKDPPAAPPVALELGALYRAHAQTVARWAGRLGGPTVDAEDVVQEVFLVAHRLLPEFRGEARITTWLFRITHNVVRHRRRRERVRRLLGAGNDEAARRVASLRPTPVEDLERVEAQRAVYGILDGMSDKYRTVFVLFELEGLSGEEVAALTGQRLGTIWVWLHRARAQFLKELGKRERKEQA